MKKIFSVLLSMLFLVPPSLADTIQDISLLLNLTPTTAISIYGESGGGLSNPLLGSLGANNSTLTLADSSMYLTVLGRTSNIVEQNYSIRGAIYSSENSIDTFLVLPASGYAGSTNNVLRLYRDNLIGDDSIDVILTGVAGASWANTTTLLPGTPQSLSSANFSSNQATFTVYGDINDATLTYSDRAGVYTGLLNLSITTP